MARSCRAALLTAALSIEQAVELLHSYQEAVWAAGLQTIRNIAGRLTRRGEEAGYTTSNPGRPTVVTKKAGWKSGSPSPLKRYSSRQDPSTLSSGYFSQRQAQTQPGYSLASFSGGSFSSRSSSFVSSTPR